MGMGTFCGTVLGCFQFSISGTVCQGIIIPIRFISALLRGKTKGVKGNFPS